MPDGYLVFPELVEVASPRSVEDRPLSAPELMATPDHMLAWLKSKPADEVVATDMWLPCDCLGATFLRASGYADAEWYVVDGHAGDSRNGFVCGNVIGTAIDSLCVWVDEPVSVTAAQAIEAIERARAELEA